MNLNVQLEHLEIFIKDCWKDLRSLRITVHDSQKVINRFSDHDTLIEEEYLFLRELQNRVIFKTPKILNRTSDYLTFEYIKGTRAFNLLVDLKKLYRNEKKIEYIEIALQLIDLLSSHLENFQCVTSRIDFKTTKNQKYNAHAKVANIFHLLTNLLPTRLNFRDIEEDLTFITDIYASHSKYCFRDASVKNIILDIPELFSQNRQNYGERLMNISRLVLSGEMKRFLTQDNIYHIDFSSCLYQCPKEDDWIALKHHEASNWLVEQDHRATGDISPDYLCTKFVRFSRFGGRKLAYRLLNKTGYNIRFLFDNEVYYFEQLRVICVQLREMGIIKKAALIHLMNDLITACSYSPSVDYLHHHLSIYAATKYYSDVFPN